MVNLDSFSVRRLKIDDRILNEIIIELDTIGEWCNATTFEDEKQVTNTSWRSTKVKFISALHSIGKICYYNVMDVNSQRFNYDLRGYDRNEFQYAHYNVGDFYKWHVDAKRINKEPFTRKLSFSLVLNDDYEGGVLEIATQNSPTSDPPYNVYQVPRQRATLIVFPSHLLHRVTPVTHGIRKSIVGWFVGPPLR